MIAGVFVGGASRRMGSSPKGLLLAPDTREPLVVRLARLARDAQLTPVFVGRCDAYRALLPDLAVVDDDPGECGPLGGLRGLLRATEGRVVALSCDLPHLSRASLEALRDAPDDAAVIAPRRGPDAPWEPLVARYDVALALAAADASLAAGERSLQSVLRRVRVREISLPPRELLDWDRPEDLTR